MRWHSSPVIVAVIMLSTMIAMEVASLTGTAVGNALAPSATPAPPCVDYISRLDDYAQMTCQHDQTLSVEIYGAYTTVVCRCTHATGLDAGAR